MSQTNEKKHPFGGEKNLNPVLEKFSHSLEYILFNSNDSASEHTFGDNGTVIAIEGAWGSGKTSFLSFFEDEITKRSEPKIYNYALNKAKTESPTHFAIEETDEKKEVILFRYNAWEDDYLDNPFLSLVGQFFSDKDNSKITPKRELVINDKMKRSISAIGGTIKSFTPKKIIESIEYLAETHDKLNERTFDTLIKNYCDLKKERTSFKDSLSELKSKKEGEIPLKIFIIDELDRCKPSYAVMFLETIKHFFGAKNVIFIIAIDKKQLIASINKFYGHNYNAELYLTRFFDFELQLPSNNEAFQKNFSESKLNKPYLVNNSELISQIIKIFKFNPREQAIFFQRLKILSLKGDLHIPIYILLIALHMKSSSKFNALIKSEFEKFPEERVEEKFIEFKDTFFIKNEEPELKNCLFALFFLIAVNRNKDQNLNGILDEYAKKNKIYIHDAVPNVTGYERMKELLEIIDFF